MVRQNLPEEITEILNNGHIAYLSTADKNNQPHITPMFFVYDKENHDFYVSASSTSKKIRNLQVNPKVSLSIDIRDDINPFNNRGVMVQGKATILKDVKCLLTDANEKQLEPCLAFRKKYYVLQTDKNIAVKEYMNFSETLIKISPEKMVFWRGSNFLAINFKEKAKIIEMQKEKS